MAASTPSRFSLIPRTEWGRQNLMGYLFISPFILGFLFWFVIPALTAAWLTFYDWNLIRKPIFIGFKNFVHIANDPLFFQSLKVTATYTLISVPLSLLLGFLVALLLNNKVRGMAMFRTIFYLPSIVPAVASAVLWSFIFNTDFGLLNGGLAMLGINKVSWLQDTHLALPSLIVMSLWAIGGGMVIYLAGLQGVPQSLYEAAEIDGASSWAKLIHVTIPLMSPVIFFNLIIGIIGSFQVFTAGFLVTAGGPQNSTLFYVLYTYRTAISYFDMGYASVLSWILFIIILGLTGLVFRYVGRTVYYESGG